MELQSAHRGDMPAAPARAAIAWRRFFHSPLAVSALFVLVGLLIYSPAIHGGLIWDDEYLVGQNPFFRSPIFAGEIFRHYLFVDNPARYYRPIQNLSYMLDYWVWSGAPLGYHLTNVFLHSASAVLLFALLRRLLPETLPPTWANETTTVTAVSFAIAMVWMIHPIHNAAVAYISGRADSLASVLALTAWLRCLRLARETTRKRQWLCGIGAAVSILLALCSKEIALIWIVLFLLHMFAFDRTRSARSKSLYVGAATVIVTIYASLRAWPVAVAPIVPAPALPITERLVLMLRALGDYTGLIFFPGRLTMDRTLTHSAMYASSKTWEQFVHLEYLSIIGFLALAFCLWLCLSRSPGQRLRLFGAGWFAAAFLPISNLVPLNAQVAEHWIYLASIGYLLFLAGCAVALQKCALKAGALIVVLALPALGVRTAVRAADWADAETFYWRTINAGGGTPRICNVLANVYGKRKDYPQQERVLRRMIELFPDDPLARINLGTCLLKQGRADEAKTFLDIGATHQTKGVHRAAPNDWLAQLQFAGLRAQQGDLPGALTIVRNAKKEFPGRWELSKREASLCTALGNFDDATRCLEEFLGQNWWHQEARLTLAELQMHNGAQTAAAATLRIAAWLDLHDPRPYAMKAQLEIAQERYDSACDAQRAAIRRNPDEPVQYLVLAAILHKLGRDEEARAAHSKAQELSARTGPPLS
jgi:tetratricopeptide (TPR) repeat protein